VLKCFTHFFVQNQVSKELLSTININNVSITGDTRFDRVLEIKSQAEQNSFPVIDAFVGGSDGPCRCFIAGSSWQPDEEIFLKYFEQKKDWKLIVAPHVIGEDHLRQIIAMTKRKVVRYTQVDANAQPSTLNSQLRDADILIIDCFGLLSSIYRYGDVAYVGGGFGVGIHNLPEAAVWNVPVFFGPNNQNFHEAQALKACGGGLEITSYDDFAEKMDHFIAHPEEMQRLGEVAGNYVASQAGATEKILRSVGL
jgi:3-deoxy-D-manno-octulosonic-acid transferase